MLQEVQTLKDCIPQMNMRDAKFAESLIGQFENKGRLSDKQWYWVEELAKRVINPESSKRDEVAVGSYKKVYDLLEYAKQHLKYPKIRFMRNGQNVAVFLAGPRSRYYGKVLVTDGERFGMNEFYGAIDVAGNWELPRKAVPPEVVRIISELAEDPAGMASEYGRLTGNCCFCHMPLKDERSTGVGYGPTCAKNYGLPWGGKSR